MDLPAGCDSANTKGGWEAPVLTSKVRCALCRLWHARPGSSQPSHGLTAWLERFGVGSVLAARVPPNHTLIKPQILGFELRLPSPVRRLSVSELVGYKYVRSTTSSHHSTKRVRRGSRYGSTSRLRFRLSLYRRSQCRSKVKRSTLPRRDRCRSGMLLPS
jgi:hypothetical protein